MITIKSNETSNKLAIYTLQATLATIYVCSCKHNSSWLASYIHACTNKTQSIANLQDLIPTLVSQFVLPIISTKNTMAVKKVAAKNLKMAMLKKM